MLIDVKNVSKAFRVPVRDSGFKNAVSGFFHRKYKTYQALDDVSFSIHKGQMVGYIGPNGAGKSTTIKILSGILIPDKGDCIIDGRVPWEDRKRHVSSIGVVFGQRSQLWWDIPAGDSFGILKSIYRIDDSMYKKRMNDLCNLFDIGNLLEKPVRLMSLGQKMRCEVAAALIHSPKILFLDEPTIGLDTLTKIKMREMLKEFNRQDDITMILTTHDLDDIEALCSRILMIDGGKIVFDGDMEQLKKRANSKKRIAIEFVSEAPDFSTEQVKIVSKEENRIVYEYDPMVVSAQEMLMRLVSERRIEDFSVENEPIEQLISRMYREG